MPGAYDPTKGIEGFQEYQGSPREENIEGEPRFFRTFYGPAENRWKFLNIVFGAVATFAEGLENECPVECAVPRAYPLNTWECQHPYEPLLTFNVAPDYLMHPISYRCEPWDPNRAHTTPTEDAVLELQPINIECGVVIEIEYRPGFVEWPDHLHDPLYLSTLNVSPVLFRPDVPWIESPTFITLEHDYSTETRTIKGRTMEVCSYGEGLDATVPNDAAPGKGNQITSDDIEPIVGLNYHTFVVTLHNVPAIRAWRPNGILGFVNNDVWFGYPAHAVLCTEITPKLHYHVSNQTRYDMEYTFVARFAPANGEQTGFVTPNDAGRYIHDGFIGTWNRVWWEHAIAGTTNHWWPFTEAGLSNVGVVEPWANRKVLFEEANFHLGFDWWRHWCPPLPG